MKGTYARCIWCGLATPLGNPHLGCPKEQSLLDVRVQVARSLLDVHMARAKAYDLSMEALMAVTPRKWYP